MYRYCRTSYLGLLAAFLALTSFGSAIAQSDPVVGSTNVATADPPIPRPPSAPCTVTLFENVQFADFNSGTVSTITLRR